MSRTFPTRTALAASLLGLTLGCLEGRAGEPPKPAKPDGLLELAGNVEAQALSHDGRILLTSDGKKLQIWDVPTGKLRCVLQARGDRGFCRASFSRDGSKVLLPFDETYCARVCDAATGKQLR